MQHPGPARAKLTRPRLHNAVARERLFRKLDDASRARAAACVVGPPGAGKTTLVASWSDARRVKGIWYQVDPGDADLATFFFYLGESARPFLRKGQRALPALTPEYLADIPGFARRFFRDLFALLPAGPCLVLDNYQEVPAEERFHQIIADAVAEVPQSQSLIVISRRDPPNCYARLIANENVAFVDWEDLRLTLEETRSIVEARLALSATEIERIHKTSGGWAAGLTLMLEGRRRSDVPPADGLMERDLLFDYFAAQIFLQVPEATRRFLMITALLPQVPVSLARELTGEPAAAEILEDLYQRHLFTHRRAGSEPTYWYHALFRGYLAVQGERLLPATHRRELESRAARLLEAVGAYDDAFVLFRLAEDWESIARLVARQADAMLGHGRGQTVREWILALPPQRLDQDSWLQYWLGTSVMPINQAEARAHLEAAFALSAASGDRRCQALAAAGVIDTHYFEWSDFRQMDSWVQRLEPFIEEGLFASEPDRELRLYGSMLIGIFYGAPRHRMLRSCIARVSEMLDEKLDVNSKLKAATFLLSYCNLSVQVELAKSVCVRAAPLLESQEVTPLNQLWWSLRLGHFHAIVGDLRGAREILEREREVAHARGLSGLRSAALLTRSYLLLVVFMQGDMDAARGLVTEIEALALPSRRMDRWHTTQARAYLAMLNRDAAAVTKWGHAAYLAAQAAGMTYVEVLGLTHEAHGLAGCGETARLSEVLSTVRGLIADTYLTYFECEVRYLIAYSSLLEDGQVRARAAVESAVRYAREQAYHYPNIVRTSAAVSAVLVACLDAGAETAYAREVIQRYRLRPACLDSESWPWAIRIHTLGRFEIQLDGAPLRFAGKTPRKPLALLKAIIAYGGSDVPQGKLIDALWPNEEGDTGKQSFGVTMVRLRKLLGVPEAIVVSDERVTLDAAWCWVDARVFESKIKRAQLARDVEDAALIGQWQAALALYQGAFLPMDAEEGWSVQMRLRLRSLFTSTIEDLGGRYEASGAWERAVDCYRGGLEADDLVEEFYLGQMRCYLAMQRAAEGMAVFRRLRQTLSVVLGVSPSPASESVARVLGQTGHTVTR